MADRNLTFGAGLTFFGIVFSLGSYLVLGNVPLTALGIGLTVLGLAWAMTPPHPVPRYAVSSIIKSACNNIEALLEATGAVERALYIPVEDEGKVFAYIPLRKAADITIREIVEASGRMVFRRGGNLGLMVLPPNVDFGNPHGMEASASDVNAVLEYALVDSELAESVSAVEAEGVVVVEAYKPRVDVEYPRFRLVMGSLPSCIAAQALAQALNKPVQIVEEIRYGIRLSVRLKVFNWTDKPFT